MIYLLYLLPVTGCAGGSASSCQGKEILLAAPHWQKKGEKREIIYEDKPYFMYMFYTLNTSS
jgi:hypothetical protein